MQIISQLSSAYETLTSHVDFGAHVHTWLGFDGVVYNHDCAFVPTVRRIMDKVSIVLQSRLTTRYHSPIVFFERMALEHPTLAIYMKVWYENDVEMTTGYFTVRGLPPPPPTPKEFDLSTDIDELVYS